MNNFLKTIKDLKATITILNNPMLVDKFFYNQDVKNYMQEYQVDRKTILEENKLAIASIINFEKHKSFKDWINCYYNVLDEKNRDNHIYDVPNVGYYYMLQYNIVAAFDLGVNVKNKFEKNAYHQFSCTGEQLALYANFLPMVRASSSEPELIKHVSYIIKNKKIFLSFLKKEEVLKDFLNPLTQLNEQEKLNYFNHILLPLENLGIDMKTRLNNYIDIHNETYGKNETNEYEKFCINLEKEKLNTLIPDTNPNSNTKKNKM
jgi:hypothetical protein